MPEEEANPKNGKCVVCAGPLDGQWKEICLSCYAKAAAPTQFPELTPKQLFAVSAGRGLVDFLSFLVMEAADKKKSPKDWSPKPPGEARKELERIRKELDKEVEKKLNKD